jgi:hypothetical protein
MELHAGILPVTPESFGQLVLVVLQYWMVGLKWDDQEHDLRPLLMEDNELHLQNLFLQHLLLLRNIVVLEEDLHLPLLHNMVVVGKVQDHDLLVLDHDLLELDHELLVLDHDLLDHDLLVLDHDLLDHDLLALPKKEYHLE